MVWCLTNQKAPPSLLGKGPLWEKELSGPPYVIGLHPYDFQNPTLFSYQEPFEELAHSWLAS